MAGFVQWTGTRRRPPTLVRADLGTRRRILQSGPADRSLPRHAGLRRRTEVRKRRGVNVCIDCAEGFRGRLSRHGDRQEPGRRTQWPGRLRQPLGLAAERITAWARTCRSASSRSTRPSATAYRRSAPWTAPGRASTADNEVRDRYRWKDFITGQAGATRARVVRRKHEARNSMATQFPSVMVTGWSPEACDNSYERGSLMATFGAPHIREGSTMACTRRAWAYQSA